LGFFWRSSSADIRPSRVINRDERTFPAIIAQRPRGIAASFQSVDFNDRFAHWSETRYTVIITVSLVICHFSRTAALFRA